MEDYPLIFEKQRLNKRDVLKQAGIPMYPPAFQRIDTTKMIRDRFSDAGHDPSEEKVTTAGRIYGIRDHGKTLFMDVGDESGRMQIYVKKNNLPTGQFDLIRETVERGDFIGITGPVFKTKVGELSVAAEEIAVLTKSLCTLPEKFHGLVNLEKRYRQRYLDLIVNEESRETFRMRSRIISGIRRFLSNASFLEFETPTLQPVYGGANARPFTTFHNFLEQRLYLRIAPELYLKRLIIGGFEKVFEIAKNFRNEDIDTSHNPEFTMVEIYQAYADYQDMMRLTEDLILCVVLECVGETTVARSGEELDFSAPFASMSMQEAVLHYTGIDIDAHSLAEIQQMGLQKGLAEIGEVKTVREALVLFFEEFCEDNLVQPTFIYDFPVENSPLAKRHRNKDGYVERFELFIAGMEIANGFSELNDPEDQMERFMRQERLREEGDDEAQMFDTDFITALGYGMPPTGGVGIGIDRLVMLLSGHSSIKEVILFPQMKRESAGCEREEENVSPAD
ncbi:MAG: lysine--tRNA ligase [Methanospirillaceae archaeon]|nr:lysine--tRNA ligase [Methanospirillaceae archaeon]